MDLKSRVLGYTGDGVIGRMYIMPEGSNLTGALTPDVVHNMRASGGVKDFLNIAISALFTKQFSKLSSLS